MQHLYNALKVALHNHVLTMHHVKTIHRGNVLTMLLGSVLRVAHVLRIALKVDRHNHVLTSHQSSVPMVGRDRATHQCNNARMDHSNRGKVEHLCSNVPLVQTHTHSVWVTTQRHRANGNRATSRHDLRRIKVVQPIHQQHSNAMVGVQEVLLRMVHVLHMETITVGMGMDKVDMGVLVPMVGDREVHQRNVHRSGVRQQ